MTKKPFVTKEKLEEIAAAVPTPFHIYPTPPAQQPSASRVSMREATLSCRS